MSSTSVTPDAPPQVQMPAPSGSTLASVVGNTAPQMPNPQSPGAPAEQRVMEDDPGNAQPTSRLQQVLSAISKVGAVVSTGLAGISPGNRPNFISGLGEGARAEQADQANQQQIKFQYFQDQVRLANLHAQDQAKQAATDEQTKAQQAAEDFQREAYESKDGVYNTHPNNGTAVLQTLQADTQANGAASITPGTHVSANGKDILIPSNDPPSLAAQVGNYKALEGIIPGLPALPAFDPNSVKSTADVVKARQDLGQHLDIMQHLLQGYGPDGTPLSHAALNDLIPSYQSQIDALTKSGNASPYQLGTLKNTLAILQANEAHHTDAENKAFANQTAQQVDRAKQVGAVTTANKEDLQDNAAANKTLGNGAKASADPFGVTSPLDSKEFNSRYNTFSKAYVQPLTKTDQQLSQFARIQSDIDKNGNMSGAESVVGLFNAIGISASPLKGMGFRINNNTVEEHANATGIGQKLYQKLLSLKSGDVVTPQQLKDYASIATQARESQYNSAIDEARRQGLPVDFLPKGNGAQIDPSTAKMYMRAANNDPNKARTAAQQAGWNF